MLRASSIWSYSISFSPEELLLLLLLPLLLKAPSISTALHSNYDSYANGASNRQQMQQQQQRQCCQHAPLPLSIDRSANKYSMFRNCRISNIEVLLLGILVCFISHIVLVEVHRVLVELQAVTVQNLKLILDKKNSCFKTCPTVST